MARDYQNALILVKFMPNSSTIGTSTQTTHQLNRTYYSLNVDGTLSSGVSSISLRNNEAAILVKSPTPMNTTNNQTGCTVQCYRNSDCNDNNQNTNDICLNPSRCNAQCSNELRTNNSQNNNSLLICSPGERRCSENDIEVCTTNKWENLETCGAQCVNGYCELYGINSNTGQILIGVGAIVLIGSIIIHLARKNNKTRYY